MVTRIGNLPPPTESEEADAEVGPPGMLKRFEKGINQLLVDVVEDFAGLPQRGHTEVFVRSGMVSAPLILSFGHRRRSSRCFSGMLDNQQAEGGLRLDAGNGGIGLGDAPGGAALHAAAAAGVKLGVKQTHNSRVADAGCTGESALGVPGAGDQVREALGEMQAGVLHRTTTPKF